MAKDLPLDLLHLHSNPAQSDARHEQQQQHATRAEMFGLKPACGEIAHNQIDMTILIFASEDLTGISIASPAVAATTIPNAGYQYAENGGGINGPEKHCQKFKRLKFK